MADFYDFLAGAFVIVGVPLLGVAVILIVGARL